MSIATYRLCISSIFLQIYLKITLQTVKLLCDGTLLIHPKAERFYHVSLRIQTVIPHTPTVWGRCEGLTDPCVQKSLSV